MIAAILYCREHARLADLCVRGIERFWPEVKPRKFLDTDRATETSLPDDVRGIVNRCRYLRRLLDLPWFVEDDTVYQLDADCLIYSHPSDFGPAAYQPSPGAIDNPEGIAVWRSLGIEVPAGRDRFVSGLCSWPRRLLLDNRELTIAYLRKCVEFGYDRFPEYAVTCEQTLLAGLWRTNLPDNPLPPDRYPIVNPTPEMVIYHLESTKNKPLGEAILAQYAEAIA